MHETADMQQKVRELTWKTLSTYFSVSSYIMFKMRTAHSLYIISNYSIHHCWEMRPLQCDYKTSERLRRVATKHTSLTWSFFTKYTLCMFMKYYTTEKHRLATIRLRMCRHRNQCGLIRFSLIQQKAKNKQNEVANGRTYKTVCSAIISSPVHAGKRTTGRKENISSSVCDCL